MNVRRGLFRLWVIMSIVFVVVQFWISAPRIRDEFRRAALDKQTEETTTLIVPVNCSEARGTVGTDYDKHPPLCWYQMSKFRSLYPEYSDLGEDDLAAKLYKNAGLAFEQPRTPWALVGQVSAFAIGVPLAVLVVGTGLVWAFAGFTRDANPR